MEPTTKKYLILTGVVVAIGIVGFAGYKMGWFSSKSSVSASAATPSAPTTTSVVNQDTKGTATGTQHIVGKYGEQKS